MKDYLSLSIVELHQALLRGEVTPIELTRLAIEKAKADTNNAFEYICEQEALEMAEHLDESKKNNLLWGIPFALKDNISTKDIPTTASCNILKGYIPPYSSETYLRLLSQGAILIGKTTLDELAMGGTGMTGHLGYTYNPWDPAHQYRIGGSSCGSAAACAAGIVPFAIGSDTGDSVRKPASYANLVGFKPTWGRISRHGLFPFAPSLDHIGFFTRNVEDSAIVLSVLAGKDEKDLTSSNRPVEDYLTNMQKDVTGMSVAVVEEIYDSLEDEDVRNAFEKTLKELEKSGIKVNRIRIGDGLCNAILPAYLFIAWSEASINNTNLDGIKFGPRYDGDDYRQSMLNARTDGFSKRIKRRFAIGRYALLEENREETLLKAQKCRRVIVDAFNSVLKENDAIILPSSPSIAPLFNEPRAIELTDPVSVINDYMAFANFGGQPSISVPLGFKNKMPFGCNLTGRIFDESTVLALAKKVEDIVGLKDLIAGENK